jgi:hypothetical protein
MRSYLVSLIPQLGARFAPTPFRRLGGQKGAQRSDEILENPEIGAANTDFCGYYSNDDRGGASLTFLTIGVSLARVDSSALT